jgi:hypothetical protein
VVHLRDFKRGIPEERRRTFCGADAATCATACTNLEWWRAHFGVCPACWHRWCVVAETLGDVATQKDGLV